MDKVNILVCDDDKEIVDAIEIYLQQEGYHVIKAYDGEQAIEQLEKNDVQLLIMDVMMPRLDGIRATLKIRENSSIPIIILSAKTEDADKILGLNIGADDRIKPFVKTLVDEGNKYLFTYQGKKFSQANYYKCWGEVMEKISADKTPHEARHTFETNLDNAKGNRKCIDMLMGHKSKDVGNRVYNHKTIEQLRETVALLK